jgi:hypothetical protein
MGVWKREAINVNLVNLSCTSVSGVQPVTATSRSSELRTMRLWTPKIKKGLPRPLGLFTTGPPIASGDSSKLPPQRLQIQRFRPLTTTTPPSNPPPFLSSNTVTTMAPSIDHRSERRTRRFSSTAVAVDGTPNFAFAFEYVLRFLVSFRTLTKYQHRWSPPSIRSPNSRCLRSSSVPP